MPAASIERDIGWLFDECVGLDHQMRGVCAVTPNAEIAGRAENFLSPELSRTVDHYAGEISPWRARKDRIGHETQCCLAVGRVYGRGSDRNEGVAGALAP